MSLFNKQFKPYFLKTGSHICLWVSQFPLDKFQEWLSFGHLQILSWFQSYGNQVFELLSKLSQIRGVVNISLNN